MFGSKVVNHNTCKFIPTLATQANFHEMLDCALQHTTPIPFMFAICCLFSMFIFIFVNDRKFVG